MQEMERNDRDEVETDRRRGEKGGRSWGEREKRRKAFSSSLVASLISP